MDRVAVDKNKNVLRKGNKVKTPKGTGKIVHIGLAANGSSCRIEVQIGTRILTFWNYELTKVGS